MMLWLIRKLFLVKEILSRTGVLHFQRYRLLQTPWFAVYLHRISASDEDRHAHDHPWDFASFILRGSYREVWSKAPTWFAFNTRVVKPGSLIRHDATDSHQIKLLSPVVWSLVFTGKHTGVWGYQTEWGWMGHETYRRRKNAYLL